MCQYVGQPEMTSVLPGWGCCRCRIYNGLQRLTCRSCGVERHEIAVPASVHRCACGVGYMPALFAKCPHCGAATPVAPDAGGVH